MIFDGSSLMKNNSTGGSQRQQQQQQQRVMITDNVRDLFGFFPIESLLC